MTEAERRVLKLLFDAITLLTADPDTGTSYPSVPLRLYRELFDAALEAGLIPE